MSIDTCNSCSARVDTDDDCDFYQTDTQGQLTYGLCERCRDRAEEQERQDEFAAFAADYEAEQMESHR